jgi:hypothetical protein
MKLPSVNISPYSNQNSVLLPQPNQQLKTTFVGVVLLSVRKNHHTTTTTTVSLHLKQFKATREGDFRYATLF